MVGETSAISTTMWSSRAGIAPSWPKPRPAPKGKLHRVWDDKDVDGVIIATPDHWRVVPTLLACQAGKERLHRKAPFADHPHKGAPQCTMPHARSTSGWCRGLGIPRPDFGRLSNMSAWQDPGEGMDVPGAAPQHRQSARRAGSLWDRLRRVGSAPHHQASPFNENHFHL